MSNTCLEAASTEKLARLRAFGFTYTASVCTGNTDEVKKRLTDRRTRFVNTIFPLLSGSLPKKYKLIYLSAYGSFSKLAKLNILTV
jgi:hypothetical protein